MARVLTVDNAGAIGSMLVAPGDPALAMQSFLRLLAGDGKMSSGLQGLLAFIRNRYKTYGYRHASTAIVQHNLTFPRTRDHMIVDRAIGFLRISPDMTLCELMMALMIPRHGGGNQLNETWEDAWNRGFSLIHMYEAQEKHVYIVCVTQGDVSMIPSGWKPISDIQSLTMKETMREYLNHALTGKHREENDYIRWVVVDCIPRLLSLANSYHV